MELHREAAIFELGAWSVRFERDHTTRPVVGRQGLVFDFAFRWTARVDGFRVKRLERQPTIRGGG